LSGTEYRQGVGVIPLLMLGQLLFGVYVNFLVGVYLREKTRYLPLITGLGAVSNIAGNFLLIPYLGMYGAAIATVVSYLLMVVSLYIVSNRLYPIPYELGRIAKLTAVVSICIVFGLAFSPGLWVKIIVFVIFPILLYWIGFFDRKEIAVLRAKLFPTKT
jgi:O-antigen/teichoic acid export membrane protein